MKALICENCKDIHLAPKTVCDTCRSTSLSETHLSNLKLYDQPTVKRLLHECWIAAFYKAHDPLTADGFQTFANNNL